MLMNKVSIPILTSSRAAMSHLLIGGWSSVANSTARDISSGGLMNSSGTVDPKTFKLKQHHMFPYKVYI